jgi:hypothetical protein
MKYSSIAHNPLSEQVTYQLQRMIDNKIINTAVKLLPIDNLRKEINKELEKYDLLIEHVLVFGYPPSTPIDSHVDYFVSSDSPCHGSLVLPWVCKNGYSVYWEHGNFDLTKVTLATDKDVTYLEIKWNSEHSICYQVDVFTPIVVRTDIPHGVFSTDSNLVLATIRFKGNPSFEELSKKFAVD